MGSFVWFFNWIALSSSCLPSGSDGSYRMSGSSGSCSDPYFSSGPTREYCDTQPTEFLHGSYQPTVGHVGEKLLIFSCDEGYVLMGSYVLTCLCGTWSHPFPRCAARDCLAHFQSGHKNSGVYGIAPSGQRVVYVYCDMTTDDGGWTVIQRRSDGTVNFYQNWQNYITGFGTPIDNFWIGLDNIYYLTGPNSELLVNMESEQGAQNMQHRESEQGDRNAQNTGSGQGAQHVWNMELDKRAQAAHARYSSFRVGGKDEDYRLLVSGYSGTAGDALGSSHDQRFSSLDTDNDNSDNHCAVIHQGAWWYGKYAESNLNGRYGHESSQGIFWKQHNGATLFLTYVEMKVRRKVKI